MNKKELIKTIKIEIENMQKMSQEELDLESNWIKSQIKNDLDSLKTILGHIITLQTF